MMLIAFFCFNDGDVHADVHVADGHDDCPFVADVLVDILLIDSLC